MNTPLPAGIPERKVFADLNAITSTIESLLSEPVPPDSRVEPNTFWYGIQKPHNSDNLTVQKGIQIDNTGSIHTQAARAGNRIIGLALASLDAETRTPLERGLIVTLNTLPRHYNDEAPVPDERIEHDHLIDVSFEPPTISWLENKEVTNLAKLIPPRSGMLSVTVAVAHDLVQFFIEDQFAIDKKPSPIPDDKDPIKARDQWKDLLIYGIRMNRKKNLIFASPNHSAAMTLVYNYHHNDCRTSGYLL